VNAKLVTSPLWNEALRAAGDPIRLSETFETAPADLVRAVKEHSLEGIIAKRKDSLYEPGKRSGARPSTESTGARSLLSAATRLTIPLMRSSSATMKATSFITWAK